MKAAHNLCIPCQSSLPILSQCCPRCANFLPNLTTNLCGECLRKSPPFERTHTLFLYRNPVSHLILQLKFHHRLAVARAFAYILLEKIPLWYKDQRLPDLLIPVPLHPSRLRQRGFNQALELARPLSRQLHIPLDKKGLVRHKATSPQSGLSAKERKKNIAQAFATHRKYTGLTIALIDDVVTTGHTIKECCKLLKKQGAKEIHIWCVARRGD